MSQKTNNGWFAAYLFYAEPWETFLINGVAPFVEYVLQNKLAEQYFFIRYWERGPHIRLRFKGRRNEMDKILRPEIKKYFTDYFNRYPSVRREAGGRKNFSEHYDFFPNNSVQFIEYEPEVERYGGSAGMAVSEELFQYSSNAVLRILKDNPEWSYETSLTAGIQMHLALAHSFEIFGLEASEFFKRVCRMWEMSLMNISAFANEKEFASKREDIYKSFDKQFEVQKSLLLYLVEALNEGFSAGQLFENEWINLWLQDTGLISKKLTSEMEKGSLIIPSWFKKDEEIDVSEKKQALWTILYSYVHMTNNRLGIMNQDEAYLAYLIKRSIENISTK